VAYTIIELDIEMLRIVVNSDNVYCIFGGWQSSLNFLK